MTIGYTPHSKENQDFTNGAHMQAREDIYPFVFKRPKEDLYYPVLKDAQYRDYNLGIDHTIAVSAPGFGSLLTFSVQERFRYPRYANCRDVTFTEHNNNSNLPSELYKIEATFMNYGYFDPERKQFLEAIVLWVAVFKELLLSGNIPFERKPNPRSNQTFCCFKFDDLRKVPGLVKFYKRWDNGYSFQTTQPQTPISPITTHFRREPHRDGSNLPRLC